MQTRLIEEFARVAAKNPKKIALITEKSQLCYDDLLALVQTLDMQLSARGVRDGQTIVLSSIRGEFSIAFALLLSLRSWTVIFANIRRVLESGIDFDRAVVTEESDLLPADKQIVIEQNWFTSLGTVPAFDYSKITGAGGNFVIQSSGTTGTPKFILSSELARLHDMRAMAHYSAEEFAKMRFLTSSGVNTSWAMNTNLPVLLGGGSVISLADHSSSLLQYIDLHNVTHLATTPALISDTLKLVNPQQFLRSLQGVLVAGAYAPPGLMERLSEMSTAKIIFAYGATETGALCQAVYSSNSNDHDGYLGDLYRNDVELVFFNDALELQTDATEGLAGFKLSASSGKRYLKETAEEKKTGFVGDYFVPGDVLRREGDSLYFLGRIKNVINVNGAKYSLDLIRRVLDHSFIKSDFEPLAILDAEGMEQLFVCYAAPTEIAESAIISVLRGAFSNIGTVQSKRISKMPITLSGKVDIQRLKRSLANL